MKSQNIIALSVLILAVAAMVVLKNIHEPSAKRKPNAGGVFQPPPAADIPRLIDIGAGTCIPCKAMMPILDELKKIYAGRMDVVVIDLTQFPDAARLYGVQIIPTQIFYDASGKELFRHEGFMSKEDILAQWRSLGIELEKLQQENGK